MTINFEQALRDWDRQQAAYIVGREARFSAMADFVGHAFPGGPKRILDLACGPGSLSKRLAERFPGTQIVSIDKDPVLLRIAEETVGRLPQVTVLSADLDDGEWTRSLPPGAFDAIVSSTALHWLAPGTLVRLYRDLYPLIVAGGLFMNADHLVIDGNNFPRLAAIAKADDERAQRAAFADGAPSWEGWWETLREGGELTDEFAARERVWAAKEGAAPGASLELHIAGLRDAGFAEVAPIWRNLDDVVVAALR